MLCAVTIAGTLWLYIRVQLFVFLCGIVGPIFLFVYFGAQPDPTIKWMYYAGLIVTAIDVLIALGLTSNYVRGRNQALATRFSS
jgi:uncharacterized RDD family membrane protein YckC